MTSSRFIDFYKALSVSPKATANQIKAAFFKLAKTCHPDISTNKGSDARFKQINDAYQTLTRDRATYDNQYASYYGHPPQQSAFSPKHSFTSHTPPGSVSSTYSSFNVFCDPIVAPSTFQWGQAWSQKSQDKQEQNRKSNKKQKATHIMENHSRRSNRSSSESNGRKQFDSRFYWSDGAYTKDSSSSYFRTPDSSDENIRNHDNTGRFSEECRSVQRGNPDRDGDYDTDNHDIDDYSNSDQISFEYMDGREETNYRFFDMDQSVERELRRYLRGKNRSDGNFNIMNREDELEHLNLTKKQARSSHCYRLPFKAKNLKVRLLTCQVEILISPSFYVLAPY